VTKKVSWVMAYAVLRSPHVLADGVDLNLQFKAVSVWPTAKAATAEVTRLNGLVKGADRYWWQSTHLHLEERA
jgi:hypothetical protein